MSAPLLSVRGLRVGFPARRTGLASPRQWHAAVDSVDLDVADGQAVGLVGESGCGKSTLARAILALETPAAGRIEWRGKPVRRDDAAVLRGLRREVQVVFQDPVGSLDPRMTVGESVTEALEALAGRQARDAAAARVSATLEEVGLDASLAIRYPHELSGGQCQRVAIARAIVARPKLLICDEAVSALDVSVQAQIVNLLAELRARHGMALLFISHNLAVVRHLCEDILVMYLGRIVERAPREVVFATPRHPYTRALLASVPIPDPTAAAARPREPLRAVTDAGLPPPTGCAFAPRCAAADDFCRGSAPSLVEVGAGEFTACHHWRALGPWASPGTVRSTAS
jgi:oligopeptide/dipeptide ABC transporter ATP-binding protein